MPDDDRRSPTAWGSRRPAAPIRWTSSPDSYRRRRRLLGEVANWRPPTSAMIDGFRRRGRHQRLLIAWLHGRQRCPTAARQLRRTDARQADGERPAFVPLRLLLDEDRRTGLQSASPRPTTTSARRRLLHQAARGRHASCAPPIRAGARRAGDGRRPARPEHACRQARAGIRATIGPAASRSSAEQVLVVGGGDPYHGRRGDRDRRFHVVHHRNTCAYVEARGRTIAWDGALFWPMRAARRLGLDVVQRRVGLRRRYPTKYRRARGGALPARARSHGAEAIEGFPSSRSPDYGSAFGRASVAIVEAAASSRGRDGVDDLPPCSIREEQRGSPRRRSRRMRARAPSSATTAAQRRGHHADGVAWSSVTDRRAAARGRGQRGCRCGRRGDVEVHAREGTAGRSTRRGQGGRGPSPSEPRTRGTAGLPPRPRPRRRSGRRRT